MLSWVVDVCLYIVAKTAVALYIFMPRERKKFQITSGHSQMSRCGSEVCSHQQSSALSLCTGSVTRPLSRDDIMAAMRPPERFWGLVVTNLLHVFKHRDSMSLSLFTANYWACVFTKRNLRAQMAKVLIWYFYSIQWTIKELNSAINLCARTTWLFLHSVRSQDSDICPPVSAWSY